MGRPSLGSSYRRLLAASAASNLADGVFIVALPLLTVQLTTSPALVAGWPWPSASPGSWWPCPPGHWATASTGAGALLVALAPSAPSPEARAAMAAFSEAAPHLRDRLEESASGRELIAGGFPEDVRIAAELDVSAVAPQLEGDLFVNAGA